MISPGPAKLGKSLWIHNFTVSRNCAAVDKFQIEDCISALPSDDPTQRKPDITLAQSKLDWMPAIELEGGLKETIAYFKRIL